MGAQKQKWSAEEETALKAGVAKHGAGRWSSILKDPEFESILFLRSNVDLKDKWRNMHSFPAGCGSRQRDRPHKSKKPITHKPANNSTALKRKNDMDICVHDPPTTFSGPSQNGSSSKGLMPMPIRRPRLDSLILDTIALLKEPRGSSRAAIAEYIEENHSAPPNLERLLQPELKALMDSGKLIKVKHLYRITPSCSHLGLEKNSSPLLQEARDAYFSTGELSATKILTKADIDAELEKMRSMTPQQAAAMAVKAVAEAEAAILEAEKAATEAEAAEADAELANVFAAAAMRALKQTTFCT